ncbi:hypothetical protein BGX31_006193, partial [Mortierella sp. GBA43]
MATLPNGGDGKKPDHQIGTDGVLKDSQQLKEANQGPGIAALAQSKVRAGQWNHNPKLGYKATQGGMTMLSAMDEDMDMASDDKESGEVIDTEQYDAENTKEWAVVEHYRDAERKHDTERSIELYGLPARVNMELLRQAANQLGDVEETIRWELQH